MASISLHKIKKIVKQKNSVHDEVHATYTVFEINGNKYFQIDTYGRADREMPEKISQSIQFDNDSAKYLVNLLVKTFNFR